MTTLLLARHGQTSANAEKRIQGRGLDMDLNDLGRRQAERLAESLNVAPIRAVYTSALKRTHQTAHPLLKRRTDLSETRLADLDEMSWGIHEGRVGGPAMASAFRDLVGQWNEGSYDVRVEGGESPRDVETRGLRAYRSILESHVDETVLVVTHGRFLRVLLASVLPGFGLARMQELTHDNTALTELRVSSDAAPELIRLADTSHLDGLKAKRGSEGGSPPSSHDAARSV